MVARTDAEPWRRITHGVAAMNRHLCEAERLTLITEAVCYCQRVKAMGMPATAYTKALREPIYFLWECRDALTKEQRPKYRSRQSLGIRFGGGSLVYDHAVPLGTFTKSFWPFVRPAQIRLATS